MKACRFKSHIGPSKLRSTHFFPSGDGGRRHRPTLEDLTAAHSCVRGAELHWSGASDSRSVSHTCSHLDTLSLLLPPTTHRHATHRVLQPTHWQGVFVCLYEFLLSSYLDYFCMMWRLYNVCLCTYVSAGVCVSNSWRALQNGVRGGYGPGSEGHPGVLDIQAQFPAAQRQTDTHWTIWPSRTCGQTLGLSLWACVSPHWLHHGETAHDWGVCAHIHPHWKKAFSDLDGCKNKILKKIQTFAKETCMTRL